MISLVYLRRSRLVLLIVAMTVVSGCGGGSSTSDSATSQINGIEVPPEPDVEINQATVAGVDVNSNGIRDDVERWIATNFGTDSERFGIVSEHARLLQASIVSPAPAATKAYIDQFRCISNREVLGQLDTLARLVLDTSPRQQAYGEAFAGAVITIDGC